MLLKRIPFILLILCVTIGLSPAAAQDQKILRMAFPEGDANSLDPHQYETLAEFQVLGNVYEGLVRYNAQTLQPEAAVAESWDVSEDGLSYTFHLRSGVTFSNGRALTADDVVYSFNRLADPKISTTYATSLILGSVAGFADVQSGAATTLSGVKALDPQTVQITLTAPNSALLPALTMPPAAVIPQEAAQDAATFGEHPVGTGPFTVQEWVKQDHITLVANLTYWGGRPALDQVIIRVITDKSQVVSELEAGNLDMAIIPISAMASFQASSQASLSIFWQSILSIYWLALNLNRPPLDNLQVRQAMSYAVDRQALVDNVLFGQGAVAHGPIPPGLSAYDLNYDPYPYDPDKARQLLADAGFPNGIDVEVTTWDDQTSLDVMSSVKSNWADVGIRATIHSGEYTDYINNLTQCNIQIGTSSWTADYADPDNFIVPLPLTDNSAWGKNCGMGEYPHVKELAQQALTMLLGPDRDNVYREAEREAVDNAMGIFLYHRAATLAVASQVHGAYLDGYNAIRLYPISIG
jgi:peptide/nickel transport system substrate-binding protein